MVSVVLYGVCCLQSSRSRSKQWRWVFCGSGSLRCWSSQATCRDHAKASDAPGPSCHVLARKDAMSCEERHWNMRSLAALAAQRIWRCCGLVVVERNDSLVMVGLR